MSFSKVIEAIKKEEKQANLQAYVANKKLYLIGKVKERLSEADDSIIKLGIDGVMAKDSLVTSSIEHAAINLGLEFKRVPIAPNGSSFNYELTFKA